MPEFQAGGFTHRTRPLCAYDQWHLLRAVAPALPALVQVDAGLALGDGPGGMATALTPLQGASDGEVTGALVASVAACERQVEGEWIPATKTIGLDGMMALVMAVVVENFGAYFAMRIPEFRPIMGQGLRFEPVVMPDGEDWLFRPVMRDKMRFEHLYDGTLRIEHVAKANALLDVQDENEARARRAAEDR